MRDRFDYATYWSLIDLIASSHRLVRFCDFVTEVDEPFAILRHDVDYSPAAALRLARQEHDRNVSATYFLLPNTPYYNLLSPEHASFARELTTLGHEVGLHYDVNMFHAFPRSEWLPLLRAQARLLEALSGHPVVSIALHQPALNRQDPFQEQSGFLNAYDARFTVETTYISDSCRAWRDTAWDMFDTGAFPRRIHLALHPINWSHEDRSREDIFRSVHDEVSRHARRDCEDLLEKINMHSGVAEHERRSTRTVDARG